MHDDLNTPQALAVLFDANRDINSQLSQSPTQDYINAAKAFFDTYLAYQVLTAGLKRASSASIS